MYLHNSTKLTSPDAGKGLREPSSIRAQLILVQKLETVAPFYTRGYSGHLREDFINDGSLKWAHHGEAIGLESPRPNPWWRHLHRTLRQSQPLSSNNSPNLGKQNPNGTTGDNPTNKANSQLLDSQPPNNSRYPTVNARILSHTSCSVATNRPSALAISCCSCGTIRATFLR